MQPASGASQPRPPQAAHRPIAESISRALRHPALLALAISVILGVAAAVRLHALTRYGFNSDEAVYSGQAAALAGNQQYAQMFGVFRAHPLLVHFLVSLIFHVTGVNDIAPRFFSAGVGIGLVALAGSLAAVARGRLAGVIVLAFTALSPYAVTVSRQMLLDGPMAFFFALTMLFLALYVRRPVRLLLSAAAAAAGLAFLAKETAILIVPAALLFLMLAREVPVKAVDVAAAGAVYLITIAPFPLSLALGGGSRSAEQFFVWQIFRRANHDPGFYLATVAPSVGIPIVALAVLGLSLALRRRRSIDLLVLSFTVVPLIFFQLWPVKGFQYLIPLVVPVAVLAADGLVALSALVGRVASARLRHPDWGWNWAARGALVGGSIAALAAGTLTAVSASAPTLIATDSGDVLSRPAYGFVAGTGGLEASRGVGEWIRLDTVPGSRFLTIGPSFANIIQFYGQRRALALAVSPNPLHRNPIYEAVENPDLLLRTNAIQYLVYDSYSASRTPFFTRKLLGYIAKYHGILVYADYQPVRRPDGRLDRAPVVLIYEVHP